MMGRIWAPVLILALENTAAIIRTVRANLLDELNKPYVETARAKGLKERVLIWKYPVRVALNPFFSTVGWTLAALVSGETLVAVVLNLPDLRAAAAARADLAGYVPGGRVRAAAQRADGDRHAALGYPAGMAIRASGWRARRYGDRKHHAMSVSRRGARRPRSAEQIYVAPQWKLMYWKFRKHRMAVASVFVLAIFYLVAIFCEFFAPYDPEAFATRFTRRRRRACICSTSNGTFRGPFIYGSKRDRDPNTLRPIFAEDKALIFPIGMFVRGAPYKLWGRFNGSIHLFGIGAKPDQQASSCSAPTGWGAIMFSRVVYGVADLALDRAGGGAPEPGPRHRAGRHLGLLRRHRRHDHPARDRVHPLDPGDPALDGALGGAAGQLAGRCRSTSASR